MSITLTRDAIRVGDRIGWTDPGGFEHTGTVRATGDGTLLAQVDGGRLQLGVRWDAPGLRVLPADAAALAVPAPAGELASLTSSERRELASLEATVEQGRAAFVAVGNALTAIRDRRLYRETHSTWEAYLRERWDIGRTSSYGLMVAAAVVADVSAIADIVPQSESVARPLAPLTTEQRREAWSRAVDEAGGPPTAAQVRQAAAEVAPRPAPAPGECGVEAHRAAELAAVRALLPVGLPFLRGGDLYWCQGVEREPHEPYLGSAAVVFLPDLYQRSNDRRVAEGQKPLPRHSRKARIGVALQGGRVYERGYEGVIRGLLMPLTQAQYDALYREYEERAGGESRYDLLQQVCQEWTARLLAGEPAPDTAAPAAFDPLACVAGTRVWWREADTGRVRIGMVDAPEGDGYGVYPVDGGGPKTVVLTADQFTPGDAPEAPNPFGNCHACQAILPEPPGYHDPLARGGVICQPCSKAAWAQVDRKNQAEQRARAAEEATRGQHVQCTGFGTCATRAEGTRAALQDGGWEYLGGAWVCPACAKRRAEYVLRMERLQVRYEIACDLLWAEIEAAALDEDPTPLLDHVLAAGERAAEAERLEALTCL